MVNQRRHTPIFTILTMIADGVVMVLAFLLSFWLAFKSPLVTVFPVIKGIPPLGEYLQALPAVIPVFWLVFKWFGLYHRRTYFSSTWHFFTITKAITVVVFSLMALTFLYREDFSYSRRLVAVFWASSIVMFTLTRRGLDLAELMLWRRNKHSRRVVLLGEGPVAVRLTRNFRDNPRWGAVVTGLIWISNPPDNGAFPAELVLGCQDRLEDILEESGADELIITRLDLPHGRIMEIILACEKRLVSVRLVPDIFSIMTNRVEVVNLDGVPLLGLRPSPLHGAWNRFLKRCLDLTGSSVGLLICSPAMAICAGLIKLTSRGPVLYRQERMGENGQLFNIYKLRTMPSDIERRSGPVLPVNDDPRATPLGRILRRLNIDELPQLWNVVRGDMSLVGPRPERPVFVERFKESIPRYMSRHLVKSGLTGWAQVNGFRGDTSIKSRVEYDMYYLENWSLFFDLKIVLLTLFSRKVHQITRGR